VGGFIGDSPVQYSGFPSQRSVVASPGIFISRGSGTLCELSRAEHCGCVVRLHGSRPRRTLRPGGRGPRPCQMYLRLLDADLSGGSFRYSGASQQSRFWVRAAAPEPQPASPHRLRAKPPRPVLGHPYPRRPPPCPPTWPHSPGPGTPTAAGSSSTAPATVITRTRTSPAVRIVPWPTHRQAPWTSR
jgi:hypothetical protein